MIDDFNIQDVMHATWQHVSAITDKKADDLVQSIRSQRIKTEIQKQVSESLKRENADTIMVAMVMPETELESVDLPVKDLLQEKVSQMDTKEKVRLVFGSKAGLASVELKQFITRFDEHKWFLIRLATIQLNVAAYYCMQNQSSVKNLYHYLFEFSQLAFGFQARLANSTLEQSDIKAKLTDAIQNYQNFNSVKAFDKCILDFIFEN